MLCEKCKVREANIKYTEIINGVKTEHNLCSHCAKEMDFGQYTALLDGEFPLGKLLSGLLGLEEDEEETDERSRVVCPTCGTSFDDFVQNSRFGCPDCYGVFDLFINDKIKQLQGSESHRGKQPKYQRAQETISEDNEEIIDDDNISIFSLLPAYALSEIKSAFIIGFYIYLPFVVVDLVISSVLLTLGMMMMSPVTISTPIKLILFVAMDGWTMLSKGLILQYFDLSINP